jgi:hypothetical protein
VMPERMSNEKLMTMKALGAEIVRTPSAVSWTHKESLISVAQRLLKEVFTLDPPGVTHQCCSASTQGGIHFIPCNND